MESWEYQSFKERLKKNQKIYIYGAGIIAYGAKTAITELFHIWCQAYLVSSSENNPGEIEQIPVKTIWSESVGTVYVLIATPEEYHQEIRKILEECGCRNYGILSSHLEYCLMGEYLSVKKGIRRIEDFGRAEGFVMTGAGTGTNRESLDICVHMAVSHKDHRLIKNYQELSWIKKVQAGAALTGQKISPYRDDAGENISAQNALYGELSVSYWAWKNDLHDIMGLFHYRRILKVEEKQLLIFLEGEADVLLPLPFVCWPDASGQYGRYLKKSDQQILWNVLEEKQPEMYRKACEEMKEPYLYNYNMLIAKKEVFTDYCEWLFPLLEEIAERCGRIEIERMPRYIGRVGEVLTSVYFLVNMRKWKIVHGEKCWRI